MRAVAAQFKSAKETERSAARWWLIAPTLFLLVAVNQLDKTNIAVIIADHKFLAEMGLLGEHARIGLLSTMFFFGYGLGLLVWGFVVDRLGPRRSAMIGVLGWALTTAWCAVAHGVTELYVARFALGLVEGCIWPVCNTYSGRWFPVREHGRIQSLWVNGNQVGLAIGLPIVTVLISAAGWRSVFWVLSAASLILLEPLLFFFAADQPSASRFAGVAETSYIADHRPQTPRAAGRIIALFGTTSFWIITLCQAGTVASLFGLTTWIPTYVTQARGLPFDALKGWVAASYVLPIAAALLMGYFADRTMRPAMVGGATSIVVAVMVLAAVMVQNTALAVILLVTTLAAPMIYAAMNVTIVHGLVAPQQIGRATGLFVGIGNLIGGLGPWIIGWLIGIFAGRYLAAFGFVSAINLVLAGLYLAIDAKLKVPAPALTS